MWGAEVKMKEVPQAVEAVVRQQMTPRQDNYMMISDRESSHEVKGHDNENEDDKYFNRNSSKKLHFPTGFLIHVLLLILFLNFSGLI